MSNSSNAQAAPVPRPIKSRRCSLDSGCPRKIAVPSTRRCSFADVSIREYDQTLGDSPSCREGAPVSLGWSYAERESISLDEFEKTRESQRRGRSELILNPTERRKVLVMNGSTMMEILRAERLVALKNNGLASLGNFAQGKLGSKKTPPRKVMASRAA